MEDKKYLGEKEHMSKEWIEAMKPKNEITQEAVKEAELSMNVMEAFGLITYRPNSTNIQSVEYDKSSSTLHVTFANGGKYQYSDVPESRIREFIAAPSAGQFFSQNIRNVFKGVKL